MVTMTLEGNQTTIRFIALLNLHAMHFPYLCTLLHLTGHMLTRAFLSRAFHGLAALPAVFIHASSRHGFRYTHSILLLPGAQ